MSRLSAIFDDANDDGDIDAGEDVYSSYKYLGAGKIVTEDYQDIEVKLDYAANDFASLDRFGRVLDQFWSDYGANPDPDHYSYTYDRAGNRLTRDNELHSAFDEDYTYDDLDRLETMDRADSFDQDWTLDGLGNFRTFDDDGTSQNRTTNEANEIQSISGSWVDPTYDDAGNVKFGPKPGDETTGMHYVYDAWNRLVEVYEDDGDGVYEPGTDDASVAEYTYDGANRRIEKVVTGTSDVHYYYNQEWQLVEERFVDGGTLLASNQYIWSVRYVDSPIVRFHDGNGDGDLLDVGDNIRYYTTDANQNVTATIDAGTGDVVDRYVYNAYGKATVYDDAWANPVAPTTDGPLYCGYFFDAETGLYQVRNRYYDAGLSTFISRDPVGYDSGDTNLYRYVFTNPMNATDPEGLRVVAPPARPGPVRPGPSRPLPFPGRPSPGLPEPYWPPSSPPSSGPPLPYPYPSPLPPGYPEGSGPQLLPQPGTQEWEDYVRRCRQKEKWRKGCMELHETYTKWREAGRGWEHETDLVRLALMCEAISVEARLRQDYLNSNCDKRLEDLFGDAEEQRKIHEKAIRGAKQDHKRCMDRLRELQKQR